MKWRRILLTFLLITVLSPGAVWLYFGSLKPWWVAKTTRDFLLSSDKLVLISMQPKLTSLEPPNAIKTAKILGQIEITDEHEKVALIDGVLNHFAPIRNEAGCHHPRHAIRALKSNQNMELTICFSCHNVRFFRNGQVFYKHAMRGDAKDFYNQTLRKHHVPVAKE